jgi:hypothetical protein
VSANLSEWLVLLSFLLLIAAVTVAEAAWLNRRGWASFGRSLGFSVLTNLIGFSVGCFVLFVIFAVVLMLAWDGSLQKVPGKDYTVTMALGLGVLFIPALLTVCKRVFLLILKIQTVKSAWLYSLMSSVLSLVVSIGIPILLGYFLFR